MAGPGATPIDGGALDRAAWRAFVGSGYSFIADADPLSDDVLGRCAREVLIAARRTGFSSGGWSAVAPLLAFARRTLAAGAVDANAMWVLSAADLYHCQNDFGMEGWRPLQKAGLLDPAWPVEAAYHVWVSSGADTKPLLCRFLMESLGKTAALAAIRKQNSSRLPFMQGWANSIGERVKRG